nr:hypothetical protein [Streptomyces tsukubensis NRRL18488]
MDGADQSAQGGALEVPGVLVEAVAVAEDDGDGRGGAAAEEPAAAGGGGPRVDLVDLVVEQGAVVGDGFAGGAAQGSVRAGRVEGEPGLLPS